MHDRRHILPVRPADLHHEIRFVDVQRRSGLARPVQQQELCGSLRLLEVGHMGHHRGARLPEHLRRLAHRNGHHILHHYPTQNPLLHRQFNSAHRLDFVPLRSRLLLAGGGRREGHPRHQHFAVTGCVPAARLQDPSAHLAGVAADRQVSAVHFHHEHCVHSGHRHHHQLELPWTANAPHAHLDSNRVPALFAGVALHEASAKDASTVDDGNARDECATASESVRIAHRIAEAH